MLLTYYADTETYEAYSDAVYYILSWHDEMEEDVPATTVEVEGLEEDDSRENLMLMTLTPSKHVLWHLAADDMYNDGETVEQVLILVPSFLRGYDALLTN